MNADRMFQSHTEQTEARLRSPTSGDALVRLLRAIAGGSDAKASCHDVIFLNAANRIERLEAELLECSEFLEGQADVNDGDYGEPSPNRAMQLVQMIDESLHGRPY